MSMLGIAIRSFLAPAGPSLLQRPTTGSKKKQEAFICMKSTGRPQVSPPVVDLIIVCVPFRGVGEVREERVHVPVAVGADCAPLVDCLDRSGRGDVVCQ